MNENKKDNKYLLPLIMCQIVNDSCACIFCSICKITASDYNEIFCLVIGFLALFNVNKNALFTFVVILKGSPTTNVKKRLSISQLETSLSYFKSFTTCVSILGENKAGIFYLFFQIITLLISYGLTCTRVRFLKEKMVTLIDVLPVIEPKCGKNHHEFENAD